MRYFGLKKVTSCTSTLTRPQNYIFIEWSNRDNGNNIKNDMMWLENETHQTTINQVQIPIIIEAGASQQLNS